MLNAVIRYLVPLTAFLVVGPLAGHLTGALRAHDGGPQASLLVGSNPMAGVIAALAVIGLALVIGAIGARTIGNRMGLFCAGLVLAWAAWGTGRVDAILVQPHAEGSLKMLAMEGLLVGLPGVLCALVILRIPVMPSARAEVRDPRHEHHHLASEPAALWDSALPVGLGAAILMAGLAVWIFAQDTHKGQTFAAAVVAGLAAAAAIRMAAPNLSPFWAFVAIAVLATVAPVIAMFVHRSPADILNASLAGRLFALTRALPLDYLAGAFVGVPIGLAWATSMVDRHAEPAPVRR